MLSFHTPFVGLFKVGTGLAAILFPPVCNAVAPNVTLGGIEWQSNKSGRVDLCWKQRRVNAGKLSFFVSYLLSLFSAIFRISKTGDATYIFPDTSQVFRLGHIPCLRPIGSAAAALPRHDSPKRNVRGRRPGASMSRWGEPPRCTPWKAARDS